MADDMTACVDNQNLNSFVKTPIQFSLGVDDDIISEPLRIQLTVYSMQGICRKSVTNGGKSPNLTANTFKPPTTALISLRGEVVHTVVPSMPLKFNEELNGRTFVQGSAFWQNKDLSEETKNGDDVSPSTFVLKREMRRQCFQPEASIGHMSHYQAERVDFVVGVGKGKDMYPLGVASIAISGEEEAEQLTNVPIKSIYEKHGRKLGKKCHQKGLFFDGESHFYGLSNHAILRVGVRVIPEHNFIPQTLRNSGNATPVTTNDSKRNKFIQFNDENSLIAEFKETQMQYAKEASTPRNQKVPPENQSAFGLFTFPFCGAMELALSQATTQPLATQPLDTTNKISEARVISMRVMSDVSGSTLRWLAQQTSTLHEA